VGAGRRRQGLGPFVARDLVAAGAEIPGFVVTSAESRAALERRFTSELGLAARGYLDLASLLRAQELDALAILSPAETHAAHLETALAAGLHVLCEKPFVWGVPELAASARRIAGGFDARGLLLWENCQWPYTLPVFAELHPGALAAPPRRFAMRLQPGSRGVQMLGDSLPHALSLLQALLPGAAGRIERPRFEGGGAGDDRLGVEFEYAAGGRAIAVAVELVRSDRHPREAVLEIDGRRAERLVGRDDYRLFFAADGRTVPLPDPLTQLVADFVRALPPAGEPARASRSQEIAERMELLDGIVSAFARHARAGALP
jgi:predicted dehydrogenase